MVRSLWWCTPSGRAFEEFHREPLIIRREKLFFGLPIEPRSITIVVKFNSKRRRLLPATSLQTVLNDLKRTQTNNHVFDVDDSLPTDV